MNIKVKLFANLLKFGPEEQEMTCSDGASVADVIQMLNLPDKIPLLRIVNGEHVDQHHRLKDGDTLALFPPIAGG